MNENEAISAVVDDGFLAEEDDDYEDLYNDVNVGEGFLQSIKTENSEPINDQAEKKIEPVKQIDIKIEPVEQIDIKIEPVEVERNVVSDRVEEVKVELAQSPVKVADLEHNSVLEHQSSVPPVKNSDGFVRTNGGFFRNTNENGNDYGNGGASGATLFVGDLHWWTTDAELEEELSKYGHVKEVKFFEEKASGKSKGYCQVDFYDPAAAKACKEGMNGHVFNGRACVVAFATPFSIRRMGEAQVNKTQQAAQAAVASKRGPGDPPVRAVGNGNGTGPNYQGGGENNNRGYGNNQGGDNYNNRGFGNFQGGGDNNRGFGRGNWGRGNVRGPVVPMRNRGGGMGGRGIMGNGGNGFGQGMGGAPPMMHPQPMMGFEPPFGGPMGRMGNFGPPPFSGILNSFPPVGGVGLPGVAPHVNPAFFGRGMAMNGMGMMPTPGVDGHNMGMWSDPNMAGWAGDEYGGRGGESSYGEEVASDHQYGEVNNERVKERDRGSERERYRDDREMEYDRDMPREKDMSHDRDYAERRHREDRDTGRDREKSRDRDRHRDERERYEDHHRYKERDFEYDDELDRGRSSRTHKSRLPKEEVHRSRSRSRDAEYGRRRRLASE